MAARRRRVGGASEVRPGRWVVRARGKGPDGRPFAIRRRCAAADVDAVLAEVARVAERLRAGLDAPATHMTLAEWAAKYRAMAMHDRAIPNPRARWSPERESTFRFLSPLHKLPLHAISAARVARWAARAHYRGEGRAPSGSGQGSRAYVRHAYELLVVLLRAAVQADPPVLRAMPFQGRPKAIDGPGRSKRPRLTPDAVRALLTAADKSDRAARRGDGSLTMRLLLALQLGVRPHCELCPAQRSWLRRSDRCWVIDFPAVKGGLDHSAPLPTAIGEALAAYWDALPRAARDTGLLLPHYHKRRWRQRKTLIDATTFRRLARSAGLSGLVLYQCRHTRLSDVATDPRLGTWQAAAIAGHADERTTSTYVTPELRHRQGAGDLSPTLAQAMPRLAEICLQKCDTPSSENGKNPQNGLSFSAVEKGGSDLRYHEHPMSPKAFLPLEKLSHSCKEWHELYLSICDSGVQHWVSGQLARLGVDRAVEVGHDLADMLSRAEGLDPRIEALFRRAAEGLIHAKTSTQDRLSSKRQKSPLSLVIS